jgi:Domain of unknown function (DUF4382)
MKKGILAALVLAVVIIAVAGFLFYGPSNVTVTVKDPPPQQYDPSISAILVSFSKIELHSANAGNESGWHTVTTGATVDLMQVLTISKILAKAQISAGTYHEIRLFTGTANITIAGVVVTYHIPSGEQTGIKVVISGGLTILGGLGQTVQLDFAFKNSEILQNPSLTLNPVVSASVA